MQNELFVRPHRKHPEWEWTTTTWARGVSRVASVDGVVDVVDDDVVDDEGDHNGDDDGDGIDHGGDGGGRSGKRKMMWWL